MTPGQAGDSPQFTAVLAAIKVRGPIGRPRTRPDAVAADKAYSSRANRAHLRRRGKSSDPGKGGPGRESQEKGQRGARSVSHDAEQYKERNTVERCINKVRIWRGLAMRSDKKPESYLAGLQLRGSIIWLRSLHPAT